MEFLITLIGNAAVDPNFRKRFLTDPVETIDHYGFRLTKGDYELMLEVFSRLTPGQKNELEQAFLNLQDQLYARIKGHCTTPCFWSIFPPPEFRQELKKVV